MNALTIHYDAEADAAYIRFSAKPVEDSAEVATGIVLDYDSEGRIVGLEVLEAGRHLPAEMLEEAA